MHGPIIHALGTQFVGKAEVLIRPARADNRHLQPRRRKCARQPDQHCDWATSPSVNPRDYV